MRRLGNVFEKNILYNSFVKAQFGNQLLELEDLFPLQSVILLLQAVKGLLGNPSLPDEVRNSHAHLSLLQDSHNLLGRKTLLLYSRSHQFEGGNCSKEEIRQKTNIKSGLFYQCSLIYFVSAIDR